MGPFAAPRESGRAKRERLDGNVASAEARVGSSTKRSSRRSEGGRVSSSGVRSQNVGRAELGRRKRRERERDEGKGGYGTITRSDIPRRTMRCNSLYPAEGEPPPILARRRRRLNSHDRSHYLLPRSPWRLRGRRERIPGSNYFRRFGASIGRRAPSSLAESRSLSARDPRITKLFAHTRSRSLAKERRRSRRAPGADRCSE